jgi:peptidoglycan/LPS O-acetylase OafA/YrhL
MFFALSGFLVAGSLERNRLHHFLALRFIRIIPALAFEVVVSACLIGAAFTSLQLTKYFSSGDFYMYFLNVAGIIHVTLPGVFQNNPLPELSNPQLWTIPYELECYMVLAGLSLLGLVWKRYYLLWVTLGLIIARTIYASFIKAEDPSLILAGGHFSGRILVIMFLVGVLAYRHRDKIPYNDLLGYASLLAIVLLFKFPSLTWLGALPTGYFVVWFGLKQLPAIPFGDLSYGVYLFHFPVTQMLMASLGGLIAYWWLFASVSLIGSAVFAAVSWRFIEKPIMGRKRAIIGKLDTIVKTQSKRA